MVEPLFKPPVRQGVTSRKRLGDVLIEKGIITQEQLNAAIQAQKATSKKIGVSLVEMGFLTSERLAAALADQLHLPMVQLKTFQFDDKVVKLLPQNVARKLQALILEDKGSGLFVTVADPFDLQVGDELQRVLNREIFLAVSPADQIQSAMDRVYRKTDEITGLARELGREVATQFRMAPTVLNDANDNTPVVRLLQSIFEDAVQSGSSDVHIEPLETMVWIRFRIDGVLHVQTTAEPEVAAALAQRLKLMAELDISEKRLPQDGRFNITVRGESLDVRLSTMPSQHGESIVMRLLKKHNNLGGLDTLGMPEHVYNRIRQLMAEANGMVLVTGPTGSGKTTTLYTILEAFNHNEMKILTVEDPIEYQLDGIIQTQVNEKINLSFSAVLRAALRQDPDVILVGEIRDQETAEIAMRGATTGHMVLSTLHTRDAASTPLRLFDMGVPPYMVATTLQAVIAQRLVRVNCDVCSTAHALTDMEYNWMVAFMGEDAAQQFGGQQRGVGCPSCGNTGYRGRTAVYEMFEMDSELIQLAAARDLAAFSDKAYKKMRNATLIDHALQLVKLGTTTVSEAMKVSKMLEGQD